MVLEQDSFGRIRNLVETLLHTANADIEWNRATLKHYVMPPNIVVRDNTSKTSLCIAVMNSVGAALYHRVRNINQCLVQGTQFQHLIMIRDRRCKRPGPRTEEFLADAQVNGAVFVQAGPDELICLNAIYETLVAIEEHDLSAGDHEIDKRQLVGFLKS